MFNIFKSNKKQSSYEDTLWEERRQAEQKVEELEAKMFLEARGFAREMKELREKEEEYKEYIRALYDALESYKKAKGKEAIAKNTEKIIDALTGIVLKFEAVDSRC